MLVLLLVAAGAGLWLWRRREDARESPECDRLDAELEGIADRQNQIVANMAASQDPRQVEAWAQELVQLELSYNEKAQQQAGLPDCEAWRIRDPE